MRVSHQGYIPSFSWARLKMEFLFYLPPILHLLLPCRILHEQLFAALFRTVRPGAALRDPLPKAGSKQLISQNFKWFSIWMCMSIGFLFPNCYLWRYSYTSFGEILRIYIYLAHYFMLYIYQYKIDLQIFSTTCTVYIIFNLLYVFFLLI